MAWLGHEEEFRGRVSVEPRPVSSGEMGAIEDVLIVAFGAGGAGTVLATSLIVWIKYRKPKVDIEITRPDGSSVTIAARGLPAETVAPLLRKALDS